MFAPPDFSTVDGVQESTVAIGCIMRHTYHKHKISGSTIYRPLYYIYHCTVSRHRSHNSPARIPFVSTCLTNFAEKTSTISSLSQVIPLSLETPHLFRILFLARHANTEEICARLRTDGRLMLIRGEVHR